MASTLPRLPPDEAPLDEAAIERLLSNLGDDMVLVGGQALAYWLARYWLLQEDEVVSHDGDALGSIAAARVLAQALKAQLIVPRMTARTALVAQLSVPTAGSRPANIDVLHQLYANGGIAKAAAFTRRVERNAVRVEWRPGVFLRVMDPLDLLEARVHNAADLLESKGPHVLTQARWAVAVARAALLKMARHQANADGRLGRKLQGVYTLAHSSSGRRLLKAHEIEVLHAVDLKTLRKLAPDHAMQLDKIAVALDERAARKRT